MSKLFPLIQILGDFVTLIFDILDLINKIELG